MKVNKSVFAIIGFLLIVGVAYWAVNYFSPPLQTQKTMPSKALISDQNLNVQTKDSQNEGINNKEVINNQSNSSQKEQASSGLNVGNENSPENKGTQKQNVVTPLEHMPTESSSANKAKIDVNVAEEQKREKLNKIRDGLSKIAQGNPKDVDFKKLDGLLVELQEMGDKNGTVAGVNIPQLRKIIGQAQKILETSQNKGLSPGEDKNAKLKEEVETLQNLQQGVVVKHE